MFLYLVQHAEAKREEEDPSRDLTAQGLQDITRVANYVGNLNLALSQILHSGKTRAVRTAEVLAGSVKPPRGTSETDGLAPLDAPETWAGHLAELAEDVMLVGHLPHLARLASLLLCGAPEPGVINFKMGSVVCLRRMEGGHWAVEWMIIPEMLL